MINYLYKQLFSLFYYLCNKLAKKLKQVVIIMDYPEYHEYMEFKHNVFIVYENEQELKNDWPNAKQIIKK